MELRRPLSALFVAAALVGGGATLTGCEAAGSGHFQGGAGSVTQPNNDNLPHLSNRIPSGPTGNDEPANGG